MYCVSVKVYFPKQTIQENLVKLNPPKISIPIHVVVVTEYARNQNTKRRPPFSAPLYFVTNGARLSPKSREERFFVGESLSQHLSQASAVEPVVTL